MAEPGLRAERYRPGPRLVLGDVTLLLVERTLMQTTRAGAQFWCWSVKAPHALVVRDAGGIWALDIDDAPVPLERLCEQVPGLDAVLASL